MAHFKCPGIVMHGLWHNSNYLPFLMHGSNMQEGLKYTTPKIKIAKDDDRKGFGQIIFITIPN